MDDEPAFAPEQVVAALNEAGGRYVIVGGLALGAHGVVRATRDLDIVPEPSITNMDRIAACLVALGGRHPIESLARPVSFKVVTRHGEVQVLNRMPSVPSFDELHSQELIVRIADDAAAPVCSLEHLRSMKRAADRPRDRTDLAELDELHG